MFKGKVAPQNSEILKCALSSESSLHYLAKENIQVSLLDFLTAHMLKESFLVGTPLPTHRTPDQLPHNVPLAPLHPYSNDCRTSFISTIKHKRLVDV